jgi:hypothetical protein
VAKARSCIDDPSGRVQSFHEIAEREGKVERHIAHASHSARRRPLPVFSSPTGQFASAAVWALPWTGFAAVLRAILKFLGSQKSKGYQHHCCDNNEKCFATHTNKCSTAVDLFNRPNQITGPCWSFFARLSDVEESATPRAGGSIRGSPCTGSTREHPRPRPAFRAPIQRPIIIRSIEPIDRD